MPPAGPPERIELLQGTLDMLILRTLLFGRAHGHEIAKHLQRTSGDVLQSSTDRFIQHCTDGAIARVMWPVEET